MRLAPHMAKGGKYRKETLPLFVLLRNATIVQANMCVNEKRKGKGPHMAKGGKYRKETLPLFVLLRNATIVQVNLYVNEKRKI